MSDTVLFLFEGPRAEQNITDNLCKFFINDGDKRLIRTSYGFNIYKLCQDLRDDPGLDLYGLVTETIQKKALISANDQEVLNIEDPENISDIYLFFDYDCHCTNASEARLLEVLNRFDDPQDDGLLCISYPMVEAIRHQENLGYSYILHPTTDLTNYKRWINQQHRSGSIDPDCHNWGLYTLPTWKAIIEVNLARANQLTQDTPAIPDEPIQQLDIYNAQKAKHIPSNEIAVLSYFPLMLHEFYGDRLPEKLVLVPD